MDHEDQSEERLTLPQLLAAQPITAVAKDNGGERCGDPSIEPHEASAAAPVRLPSAGRQPPSSASRSVVSAANRVPSLASPYQRSIPQAAFAEHLRSQERSCRAALRAEQRQDRPSTTPSRSLRGAQCDGQHEKVIESHQSVEERALSLSEPTGRTPKRSSPVRSPKSKLQKFVQTFAHVAPKDPFSPKPPIHATPMRLEAAVSTLNKMFFPKVSVCDRLAATSRPQTSASGQPPPPNAPKSNNVAESQDSTPRKVDAPPTERDTSADDALSELNSPGESLPLVLLASNDHMGPYDDDDDDDDDGSDDSAASFNAHDPEQRAALDTLANFIPEGYREPEVAIKERPLKHPNDPISGKPRQRRRYRLGFQADPANVIKPEEAMEIAKYRQLPTTLSIASIDPKILAVVDAFIECSPGLEKVELGTMDERYEMVLRNVYTALSRNVSVAEVTGNFPKRADRAIHGTLLANTERREQRLQKIESKKREMRIAAIEQKIIEERRTRKKIQYEAWRERDHFCEVQLRSYRALQRHENNEWRELQEKCSESLEDARRREHRRHEWWKRSVDELENTMNNLRLQDSREEHSIRETIRLEEVNMRLALQIQLRRTQKSQENERHSIFALQFNNRKIIQRDEKLARRAIESVLIEKLRAFLEAKKQRERREKEEEHLRLLEEQRTSERLRKLERDQGNIATIEIERRKVMEIEFGKEYDILRRKHFEGLVVAKNQQRNREAQEKREAAFREGDAKIPTVHFKIAPTSAASSANAAAGGSTTPSSSPAASNTLQYRYNTVGDQLILNTNAIFSVKLDCDNTPLTTRQKLAKAEPQAGVISCRVNRQDEDYILTGREGVMLFIPTIEPEDVNVAVENYMPRSAGGVLPSATPHSNHGSDSPVHDSSSPDSPVIKKKSNLHSKSAKTPLVPQKSADELDMEIQLAMYCGEDRVFGTLGVRDEVQNKSSKFGAARRLSHRERVMSAVFDPMLEELRSDTEDEESGSDNSDEDNAETTKRKGKHRRMVDDDVDKVPKKKPKRRIVSWNGEDVGVVELGYAGAPIELSKLSTYYNNTAVHKIRSRGSIVARQVNKRRGTVDVTETTTPPETSMPATTVRRRNTIRDLQKQQQQAAQPLQHQPPSPPMNLEEGTEVFRLRLFPKAPRHAISDIIAHLSYFCAQSVPPPFAPDSSSTSQLSPTAQYSQSLAHINSHNASPPPPPPAAGVKLSTTVSLAFLKSCLSRSQPEHDTPNSGEESNSLGSRAFGELENSRSLGSNSAIEHHSHFSKALEESDRNAGVDLSELVWSTRTTFVHIRHRAPLFFAEPQKEAVYFLEDQPPLPICSNFGVRLPITMVDLTSSSVTASTNALLSQHSVNLLRDGNVLDGSEVILFDTTDSALDSACALVGRVPVQGFHVYLSILHQSKGDVFVLSDCNGFSLGLDYLAPLVGLEQNVATHFASGRRFAHRLDDCPKSMVGVEVKRVVRDIYYQNEVVAQVEGQLLGTQEFERHRETFGDGEGSCMLSIASSDDIDTPGKPKGKASFHLKSVEKDSGTGPVKITILPNKHASLYLLRDLLQSLTYANLNKDPSAVKRLVDVALADKARKYCSVVRTEVTVVPVDDITEIELNIPKWGFQVYRAPPETRSDLVQYLPEEPPFFVCPEATAQDPDSASFQGGWLEVEIIEGLKDGDVLYLMPDDRMYIEPTHKWSYTITKQCTQQYFDSKANRNTAQRLTSSSPVPKSSNAPRPIFQQTEFCLEEHSKDELALAPSDSLAEYSTHRESVTLNEEGDVQSPQITMGAFTEADDDISSEMLVTCGLALDEVPPLVSRRDMSRGRLSGSPVTPALTPQTQNALDSARVTVLQLPNTHEERDSNSLVYAAPLIRIEFKEFTVEALQHLLRRICYKSVGATEKNTKYFGMRTIEIRTIVGDPTIPKFRKFDPFVPIVHKAHVNVVEPLLKTVMHSMNYKEGQGTMGLAVGLLEAGGEGYRCFNRGFFSASIVKGNTPDDRLLIRTVDPSQFDYGLSFLDIDPASVFQQKRSVSMHNLKRMVSTVSNVKPPTREESVGGQSKGEGSPPQQAGGEVNANCHPPPQSIHTQWVKAIASGKYKFQQWKCCELYNSERSMLGFLTSTYSEMFVGFRESDKVRKFGKAVSSVASPAKKTPSKDDGKKKNPAKDKAASLLALSLAEKEARAIPVVLPEGATPIRYSDIQSLIKLLSYENRSSNPTDLKKVILLTLCDETTTTHLLLEIVVQPVDDATEIQRAFQGPLSYRHGFESSYIAMFDHCTLVDPDTEVFNGGYFNVALTHAACEGDVLRMLTLDEQRRHREFTSKDPFAKFRGKSKALMEVERKSEASTPKGSKSSSPLGRGKTVTASIAGKVDDDSSVRPESSLREESLKSAPPAEKIPDPNEPYEFVVDGLRRIIYWLDRSKKVLPSTKVPLSSPSGKEWETPFVDSGAFTSTPSASDGQVAASASKDNSSAPTTSAQGNEIIKKHEEGVLRRIATFTVNVEVKKPKPPATNRRQSRAASVAAELATPRVAAVDGSRADPSEGGESQNELAPAISVTEQSQTNLLQSFVQQNPAGGSGGTHRESLAVGLEASMLSSNQLMSAIFTPSSGSSSALNLQIKLDPLINEDDIEDDNPVERPAPVNINMLQQLMRCIVFANAGPQNKVKSGLRQFLARVAPAGGGEDGKARIVVQTSGTLIGFTDNIVGNTTFRPRLGNIFPLQRFLFLTDLIIRSGFLCIEIAEGFEPTEDIIRLNEIGRTFALKGKNLTMQSKDQLIGQYNTMEIDGVTCGFLISFDVTCRVSGAILQVLARSFSYTNSTRRTGKRKLRVTMCDGSYYETSVVETIIKLEQDEDTIPVKFGASQGTVVHMDNQGPIRLFPDISLALKGPNADRVLSAPACLDLDGPVGCALMLEPSGGFAVNSANGKLTYGDSPDEIARVIEAMYDEGLVAQPPSTPKTRKSAARRQSGRDSVVSLGSSMRGFSTSQVIGLPKHRDIAPNRLRIEFLKMNMSLLQPLIRCIAYSRVRKAPEIEPDATEASGVGRRGTVVTFGSNSPAEITSPSQPSGALATSFSSTLAPPQHLISMQLAGLANEFGKVSYVPCLSIGASVRICYSSTLFTLPSEFSIQGIAGDLFNAIQVKFPPRLIRISWQAVLKQPPPHSAEGTESAEEAEERERVNAAATQFASTLHVGVSGRLGLVVSSTGGDITYGRDKVATVLENVPSLLLAVDTPRHVSVAFETLKFCGGTPKDTTLQRKDHNDTSHPDVSINDPPPNPGSFSFDSLQDLVEGGHAESMEVSGKRDEATGGSTPAARSRTQNGAMNSASVTQLQAPPAFPTQQFVLQIPTGSRITAETVQRLMRSIVTYPMLNCDMTFTITFEASEATWSQSTVTVIPPVQLGRKGSRASLGGGPRPPVGRRNSRKSLASTAATVVAVERLGRAGRKK